VVEAMRQARDMLTANSGTEKKPDGSRTVAGGELVEVETSEGPAVLAVEEWTRGLHHEGAMLRNRQALDRKAGAACAES
jgi:hypothetical protein